MPGADHGAVADSQGSLPAVALLPAPPPETTQGNSGEEASAASRPPSSTTLTPALIVQYGDDILTRVKPGQLAPETVALDAARAQAAPVLLLVAQAEPPVSESVSKTKPPEAQKKPFGFSWFVPELLRHKRIWRDVLLTSLAIQLVGLATPLFTQVIIDDCATFFL